MNRKTMNFLLIVGLVISLGVPMMMTQAKQLPAELDDFLEEFSGTKVKTLIQTTSHDYDALISKIESLGGTVSRTFDIATGIAAELPNAAIKELQRETDIVKISKDVLRYRTSSPLDIEKGEFSDISANELTLLGSSEFEVRSLSRFETETILGQIDPDTYWNFVSQNAAEAWGAGFMGNDSLVVIIDTGVYADHVMLNAGGDYPVIGGVDLSGDIGTQFYGFDRYTNHYHGTHVAGIVAGAAALGVPEDHLLSQSFQYYTGISLPVDEGGYVEIPLLGTAPLAEIFGIKVFDHTGGGVPESEIIASIEYAIDMHESGDYDVDVISMSLGGGTGFDGRDLEDQTVDYATSIGITVVTSNGNDGPVSMTTGSPGTANTAISVGAAANPVNTRIYWDLNNPWWGPYFGIGDYLFVSETPQIYAFSSRGPTADGRVKPTLSATGMYVLSAVTPEEPLDPEEPWLPDPTGLAWASGTSMSCPAVSGAVAVLNTWGEFRGASPYDYKQALIRGADWLPGFDVYDQGAGYLNIGASLEKLMNDHNLGDVEKPLKRWYKPFSSRPKGINTHINGRGSYEYDVTDLKPGEAIHFYLKADRRTDHINIKISDVDYGVDIGLNSFEVYVSSAVRSSLDSYIDSANVWGDAEIDIYDYSVTWSGVIAGVFTHDAPAPITPGYIRVVLENDWTSFDDISGKLEITVERDRPFWSHGKNAYKPSFFDYGKIETGEAIGYIPMGAVQVVELHWVHDWQRYPTYDLDMVVAWFNETGSLFYEYYAGGSLRSPEGVYLPESVNTYVLIFGYETYGRSEWWFLFGWDTL